MENSAQTPAGLFHCDHHERLSNLVSQTKMELCTLRRLQGILGEVVNQADRDVDGCVQVNALKLHDIVVAWLMSIHRLEDISDG